MLVKGGRDIKEGHQVNQLSQIDSVTQIDSAKRGNIYCCTGPGTFLSRIVQYPMNYAQNSRVVVFCYGFYPLSFRVTSAALGQSHDCHDCPSAMEAIMNIVCE